MAYQDFLILFFSIFLIVITTVGYLLLQVFSIKRKINIFFKKGEKDLENVLNDQFKKLEKQEKDFTKISEEISRLNKISQKSLQKIGVVRFNPFNEVGGDQSFSIALLDANNDGFVITSYYSRDINRVYAKSILRGNSRHPLSKEEKRAIEKAINQEL